jgi:predicted DNA-binding ribbon-helix-helix protein
MTGPSEANQDRSGTIVKHSLAVAGHRTSISLESIFWEELKKIANTRGQSLARLIASIDATGGAANLSSAIRVFVLKEVRDDPSMQERPKPRRTLSGLLS